MTYTIKQIREYYQPTERPTPPKEINQETRIFWELVAEVERLQSLCGEPAPYSRETGAQFGQGYKP